MSKVGNQKILIPDSVNIFIKKHIIYISGPKGSLNLLTKFINIYILKNKLHIKINKTNIKYKKFHGLYRSLISNMITGVYEGFIKALVLVGVGYRINKKEENLILALGFSHTIYKKIPRSIIIEISKQNQYIQIIGIQKDLVNSFAAQIRSLKPPEPYLGKGIRYNNEIIKKKQGKTNAK